MRQREASIDELTETLLNLQQLLPIRCSCVASALGAQPKWFQDMQSGAAISAIESTHGLVVATSIRLFYGYPAYAVFLKVHREINVFLDDWIDRVPSAPIWTKTTYPPWLAIAEDPISSMFLMVRLDSHCPEISWRYHEIVDYANSFDESFDDWLLLGARETLQKLRSTEGCFVCEDGARTRDA